jgi:hypothetical protein
MGPGEATTNVKTLNRTVRRDLVVLIGRFAVLWHFGRTVRRTASDGSPYAILPFHAWLKGLKAKNAFRIYKSISIGLCIYWKGIYQISQVADSNFVWKEGKRKETTKVFALATNSPSQAKRITLAI